MSLVFSPTASRRQPFRTPTRYQERHRRRGSRGTASAALRVAPQSHPQLFIFQLFGPRPNQQAGQEADAEWRSMATRACTWTLVWRCVWPRGADDMQQSQAKGEPTAQLSGTQPARSVAHALSLLSSCHTRSKQQQTDRLHRLVWGVPDPL